MPPFAQTSGRTTTIRYHTERSPATTARNARLQRCSEEIVVVARNRCKFDHGTRRNYRAACLADSIPE